MSIRHHLNEELLMTYGAGDLPEAVALFVATHLALCLACRAKALYWEQLGGDLLRRLPPSPLAPDRIAQTLARLDGAPPAPEARPDAPTAADDDLLPEPLRSYAGGSFATLRWRWRLPGLREALLPISLGGIPVRISRLSSFLRVPLHTHRGPEYTLVLAGGLRDEHGTYERGDVQVYDASHRHSQRVLPGEPCVCLLVNSARLVPLTRLGRVMARVTGV